MIALMVIGAVLLGLFALWVLYLATMNLQRCLVAGTISKTALRLGYAVVGIGTILDIVFNITLGTLVLMDVPGELTLSQRLTRLKAAGGWRGAVAEWIGSELLDCFDYRGRHI